MLCRVLETGTGAIYLVDPLNQTIGEIYNAPDANWIVALLNSVTRDEDVNTIGQAYHLLGQARAAIGQSLLQLDQLSCRKKTAMAIFRRSDVGEIP